MSDHTGNTNALNFSATQRTHTDYGPLLRYFYCRLEEIESDLDWWKRHPEDLEFAEELGGKADALLNKVAKCTKIPKADQHRICCTACDISDVLEIACC